MARLFLSYHRSSEAIAHKLVEDGSALGHEGWFDRPEVRVDRAKEAGNLATTPVGELGVVGLGRVGSASGSPGHGSGNGRDVLREPNNLISNVPFPLTPTLSHWEREHGRPVSTVLVNHTEIGRPFGT